MYLYNIITLVHIHVLIINGCGFLIFISFNSIIMGFMKLSLETLMLAGKLLRLPDLHMDPVVCPYSLVL